MEGSKSILEQYLGGTPKERWTIIYENFPNFIRLVDSFMYGIVSDIYMEKTYNRQFQSDELGVRVQTNRGNADPTCKVAMDRATILKAVRTADFSGGLLSDTDDAEKHRRNILLVQTMREEYDTFSKQVEALRPKDIVFMKPYLMQEKNLVELAIEFQIQYDYARLKAYRINHKMEKEAIKKFRERI